MLFIEESKTIAKPHAEAEKHRVGITNLTIISNEKTNINWFTDVFCICM